MLKTLTCSFSITFSGLWQRGANAKGWLLHNGGICMVHVNAFHVGYLFCFHATRPALFRIHLFTGVLPGRISIQDLVFARLPVGLSVYCFSSPFLKQFRESFVKMDFLSLSNCPQNDNDSLAFNFSFKLFLT